MTRDADSARVIPKSPRERTGTVTSRSRCSHCFRVSKEASGGRRVRRGQVDSATSSRGLARRKRLSVRKPQVSKGLSQQRTEQGRGHTCGEEGRLADNDNARRTEHAATNSSKELDKHINVPLCVGKNHGRDFSKSGKKGRPWKTPPPVRLNVLNTMPKHYFYVSVLSHNFFTCKNEIVYILHFLQEHSIIRLLRLPARFFKFLARTSFKDVPAVRGGTIGCRLCLGAPRGASCAELHAAAAVAHLPIGRVRAISLHVRHGLRVGPKLSLPDVLYGQSLSEVRFAFLR